MRADPACRIPEHRSTDWSLECDTVWQCGVCQAPSRGLAKAGMVVYRDNGIAATAPAEGLSPAEVDRLDELERVVAHGLQTFVEVGNALAAIRDQRLYRAGHATFEGYCRERWGFSRQRGLQLIDAAGMTTTVVTAGLPAPTSERQARELAPLLKADEAAAVEVWRELRTEHGDRLTGQIVKAAVNERLASDARRNAGLAAIKSSSSHDWGTPETILDRVRLVHGGALDLDPCTSEWHQQRVRAERYFTVEDNGLAQEWQGARAFVNPPFGDVHREFAAKLLNEYEAGRIGAAIFLGQPSATAGSAWFLPLWEHVVCFCHRRVEFVHPDGRTGGGPDGTILVYVGPDRDRFAAVFGELGEIVDRRWRRAA